MRNVRAWFPLTAGSLALWAATVGAHGLPAGSPQVPASGTILQIYRSGDAEAALRTIAALDEDALRTFIDRTDDPRDPWDAAALALMHGEAGYRVDSIGPDGRLTNVRGLHSSRMHNLIERHACRESFMASDAALATFCREWTLLMPSEDLARRFPDDSAVLIARGAARERNSGPFPQSFTVGYTQVETRWYPDTQCPVPTSSGCVSTAAYDAIRLFTRALEIDPTAVEARLRRGRVLAVIDKTADAERDLIQAVTDAQARDDRSHQYLALLLLGQLSERARRPEAALERYRAAHDVAPEFPVAALAMARLRVLAGSATEAAADLARVLTPDLDTPEPGPPDPWMAYSRGIGAGVMADALAALRPAVRR